MKEIVNLEGEVWRPIVGYEGLYEVSNLGRVKCLEKIVKHVKGWDIPKKSKAMKSRLDKNGYCVIALFKEGKNKTLKVHRLVAIAFHPNPENKKEVNHINGIKHDNRAENLEWNTMSENQIHRSRVLGIRPHNAKVLLNTQTGIYYDDIGSAAKSIGITRKGLTQRFKRGTKPNPFIFA